MRRGATLGAKRPGGESGAFGRESAMDNRHEDDSTSLVCRCWSDVAFETAARRHPSSSAGGYREIVERSQISIIATRSERGSLLPRQVCSQPHTSGRGRIGFDEPFEKPAGPVSVTARLATNSIQLAALLGTHSRLRDGQRCESSTATLYLRKYDTKGQIYNREPFWHMLSPRQYPRYEGTGERAGGHNSLYLEILNQRFPTEPAESDFVDPGPWHHARQSALSKHFSVRNEH
jgi:hypothetical protein